MSSQNVITLETIKKNIDGFNKMLSEENSELIKISYWSLVEQQFKLFIEKNGCGGCVELIFRAILARNFELLKLKNLFYLIINFAKVTDYDMFVKEFFLFVNEMIRNYNDTKILFNDFLFDFAFSTMAEDTLQCHSDIVRDFFKTFFEVDKNLTIFTFEKFTLCNENSANLLEKNENFIFFFKVILKKLIASQEIELIRVLVDNFYSFMMNSSLLNQSNHSDSSPSISQKLIEISSFLIKRLKKINLNALENFNFTTKQAFITIFIKIFLILKSFDKNSICKQMIEEYLLFLIEFCLVKNLFIPEFLDFFKDYINSKYTVFIETLLTYFYSISNEFYEKNSFEKMIKIIILVVNLEHRESVLFKLLPKLLYKKFEQQNKFKQLSTDLNIKLYNEFNKEYFVKSLYNENEYSSEETAFEFYRKYEKYQNVNDLNLINFIIKRCFSYNSKENLDINTALLNKYLNLIFNLNLEKYNQLFKNFSLSFFAHLTLLFTSDRLEINETVISQMRNYPDKMYIKTSIYPLILSFLQTVYIDKFAENVETNSQMNRTLFGLLFEYCREDSIANILCKLLTRLYQLPAKTFANKELALDLFNEMILKKNSTKYVDTYFKFIISNLKKEGSNIDLKYLNYKYLYKYCQNYDCSLLSDLLLFMTDSFDKKLEILYNFSEGYCDLDTLFTFSCVFEIIKKEESKNIIDKVFEYFLNNKLIKIVNNFQKPFQNLGSEKLTDIIGNYNYLDLLNIHSVLSSQSLINNKEIISILIFRSISQIFSLFLRNTIVINSEQLKDRKNYTTNQTIMQIFKNFDFLSGNVIFSEDALRNLSAIIYINEIFANYENLIFFYNTYSSYKSMHLIEDNNLEFSLLSEVNNKLILDSNKKLFDIYRNSKNYLLLTEFLNNILKFESKFFEKKDVQESTNYVIEDLNQSFFSEINSIKLENKNIFSKIFVENVFEIDILYQDIQVFLVLDNIILKYFKQHLKLLNPQFIVIIVYNVMKHASNKCPEIQDSVVRNVNNLLSVLIRQNKGVFITLMRLFTSEITFKNFCLKNQLSKDFVSLIEFISKQTILFNSYKPNIISHIINILDIIEKYILTLPIDDGYFLANCNNYFSLLANTLTFVNEKMKNEKKEIELSKKTLELVQETLNKRIAKMLNFLASIWEQSASKLNNRKEYLELLLNLSKYLFDNNQKIVLLNETSSENKGLIDHLNLFNEAKDLSKLNQILTKTLEEENSSKLQFLESFIVLFRSTSASSNKFAYDTLNTLLFNKESNRFNRKKTILMISLILVFFLIEKTNLNLFITNYKELSLLSIFMLRNISKKMDLDKTMNFPEKNLLLD